ncbi:hypothetical protein SAMN06269185_1248 [Natronoarchaeum philippinense]|uniref:HIT zinc finger n=1 Tax=Natronoarchaeum philippinense TaxID=558529 RepID=A0A285NB62_NATPI|nr:hypothetical protein [Natronoarchaeum philippinense]SNZ06670.1 hypothetical protein SAMN06269185_1248 [Natronoarchaeum philippinense]
MSVSGLCQVCEVEPATHDCARCGTFVCDNHFHRTSGLCSQCASESSPGEGGGPARKF